MNNFQVIRIDDREYFIVDSIQDLRAEDSFIHNRNKLSIYDGSGEARKYVGSYTGESGERLSEFFEYNNWGNTKVNNQRTYPIIQSDTCFFSKSNLLKYLYDARIEYQEQEQVYHNDISVYYEKHLQTISSLNNEMIVFSLYDVSDFRDNPLSRAYIRSNDEIWNIWRRIVLPKISYLSILKLIPTRNAQSPIKPLFYFRILLDYQFRSIVHPNLIISSTEGEKSSDDTQKYSKTRMRQGADLFRKRVFEYMPQCPFSRITDERLLIASHIKPYNVCLKEGRDDQARDLFNGLTLSPTYDRLFDQGYITFKDNGDLICGTLLSPYTWERLNINPNARNNMRIYPEERKQYLEYHRRFVFLDEITNLL